MVAVCLCGLLTSTCFWSCMQVVEWTNHLNIHVVKRAKGCLGLKFTHASSIMGETMSAFGKWKTRMDIQCTNKRMFGKYLNTSWKNVATCTMKASKRQMLPDEVNWKVLYSCQVKLKHCKCSNESETNIS